MSNDFKDRRYEKAHSILTDLVTAISMNMEFLERKGCDIEKEINFNNYVKICSKIYCFTDFNHNEKT